LASIGVFIAYQIKMLFLDYDTNKEVHLMITRLIAELPGLEKGMIVISILSFSIPSFSQVIIDGIVKSSVDDAIVDNALVKLIRLEITDLDTTRTVLDSTYTDLNGYFSIHLLATGVQKSNLKLPAKFELSESYPNPFSEETQIDINCLQGGQYQISIYNILGQQVATQQRILAPGGYSIHWKGWDLPGVYFVKTQSGDEIRVIKLVQLAKGHNSHSLKITSTATSVLPKQSVDPIFSSTEFFIVVSKENYHISFKPVVWYGSQTIDIMLIKSISEVSSVIGPSGGKIEINDQTSPLDGITLIIPDSALVEEKTLKVSLSNEILNAPLSEIELIGPQILLEPQGADFLKPIIIEYPLQEIPGEKRKNLVIGLYQHENNRWDFPSIVLNDTINNKIIFVTNHFSTASGIILTEMVQSVQCDPFFNFSNITGTEASSDAFPIANFGDVDHTIGYCGGIVAFTKWYFENSPYSSGRPLFQAYDSSAAKEIARKAHSALFSPANVFQIALDKLDPKTDDKILTTIWKNMIDDGAPQMLGIDKHVVLVIAVDWGGITIFDPNHLDGPRRISINDGDFEDYKVDDNITCYDYFLYSRLQDTSHEIMANVFLSMHLLTTPRIFHIPEKGEVNKAITLSAGGSECNQHAEGKILYQFIWHHIQSNQSDVIEPGASTQEIIFPYAGDYSIDVTARCTDGEVQASATAYRVGKIEIISSSNSAPLAKFSINPGSGTTETIFSFDASACSDEEDKSSLLQVRWDWENDGKWDTGFTTNKTATHQFQSDGTFTIMLEVIDTSGQSSTIIKQLVVAELSLNVTPTSCVISSVSGSNSTLSITSNITWEISDNAAWLTCSPANGTGNQTVTVEATNANTSSSSRSAIVTITNGELTKTVTVIQEAGSSSETGTVYDIDGNRYQTIKIGTQWWMAENLEVTHYRNGDAIPNVSSNTVWGSLSSGAYCIADYGHMYNWYAVDDSRGLAPDGWRVADDGDWQTLIDYLGGSSVAGGKMKSTGTSDWSSPNTGATNESGFSAFPGGYRHANDGSFNAGGEVAFFWSASGASSTQAWYRDIFYNSTGINPHYSLKRSGMSVRCIRN
jgi:uncharacterized protein (TIGR02145 family)